MQKILIIGCGLIGSSVAKAIRNKRPKVTIYGFDSDKNTLETPLFSEIIDEIYNFSNKDNFDLVIISTPLSSYADIFAKINDNIEASLVIDLGSLNHHPLKLANSALKSDFISCHPIAGSEKSGILNSDSELFIDKEFIVSFTNNNRLEDKNKANLQELVDIIGSRMRTMDPKEHDKVYSLVSHLPQFLSFLTVGMAPNFQDSDLLKLSFRLNSSNPEIWTDIFDINSSNIENYYNEFFDNLCNFIENIDSNDISNIFSEINKDNELYSSNKLKSEVFTDFNLSKKDISIILFRLIIALSYAKIEDINMARNYAGNGFEDFTSIIRLFKEVNEKLLHDLFKNHKSDIFKYFDKISM